MMPGESEKPGLEERREGAGGDYPRDSTVHALFDEQAAGDPGPLALLSEGGMDLRALE